MLVFINVIIIYFLSPTIQVIINIKLLYTHQMCSIIRHNIEASTLHYINIHAQKRIYLPVTTNYTGIVPSLDCSNTVTYGSCPSAAALMSLSLRLVKLYKSC